MGYNKNTGPTHAIKVAYQVGKAKRWVSKEIGVAFVEDDGSFTIKIHHGMALVPQAGVTVKAWPIDEKESQPGRRGGNRRPPPREEPDEYEDDDFPAAGF